MWGRGVSVYQYYSCMCSHIAWSLSIITKGVSIVVSSDTVAVVEALLILEYQSISKGLCSLNVAINRPSSCIINTLLVCVIGLLLSSAAAAAAAVDLFVVRKYELVPSIIFTTCCPYN